ncbi:energy-coupling factor ABC transporter ATP-binding protein [Vibrio sp. SCSIO 43132]|uniref:ABC transporter ATP-binding protein n=1 Tax=Vibrio sp. SCSIO 43132 TaxID=2779363 RepID=UPI001CA94CD4|nr:ABC transporter ATP-binding protein [Vibrio sp. SCSIO 43132]UAB73933.1 energy-coupling factor ABC transporter ATP-binding protein [Vibrio sp. SCSIO 43132]
MTIEFSNFSFRYESQSNATLKNLNLQINPGEKILIIGPSGSGKSTLGHCLNGLIPASFKGETQGSLNFKGVPSDTMKLHQFTEQVGTVLQDTDSQFVGLSVAEDIAFALENQRVTNKQMLTTVEQTAKMVDLESMLADSPHDLSGGQKQRVSLAGVLVDEVDILLFDEPLASLDPVTSKKTIDIIDKIHKETQKTVVIIEHRLEDVLHQHVDRVVLMNKGQIVHQSTPDELLKSGLLTQYGIREPLYLSALKKAQCSIEHIDHLSQLSELPLDDIAPQLNQWMKESPLPNPISCADTLLSVSNLSYSYDGQNKVLDNVSFEFKRGEFVSILGKNGSGKSTLIKLIMGVLKPDSGQLIWENQDLAELSIFERSKKVGVVQQNPNHMISQHMIFDEVAFSLRNQGISESQIESKVLDVLELCGLKPFRHWPIEALSYGQRKRVTIASILVSEPELLILDEPTAGQDYRNYTSMLEFIRELNRKLGITVAIVSHDMHLVLEYTTRAILISDGKVIADAPVTEVFSQSDLLQSTNLAPTSLYVLANKVGIEDASGFMQKFISEEVKGEIAL